MFTTSKILSSYMSDHFWVYFTCQDNTKTTPWLRTPNFDLSPTGQHEISFTDTFFITWFHFYSTYRSQYLLYCLYISPLSCIGTITPLFYSIACLIVWFVFVFLGPIMVQRPNLLMYYYIIVSVCYIFWYRPDPCTFQLKT